jgi:sec-independent protein translocase protein TatA
MPFGPEVLIVLAVVLLLFGSAKLPQLARSLGSARSEYEAASRGEAAPNDDAA